jgi:hypothetical protein
VPVARELFQFAPMHATDIVWVLIAGVTSVLWFELYKFIRGIIAGLSAVNE